MFLILLLSCGCIKNIAPVNDPHSGKGRIVLGDCGVDIIEEFTKANPGIGEFLFTISGTTSEGETVTDQTIEFTHGATSDYAYFEAGRYTLTASYEPAGANSGNGLKCFSGTSAPFDIVPGGSSDISILLTISNASITLVTDPLFDSFYSDAHVEFTQPRSVIVSTGTEVYMPAGEVVFNITATALNNTSAAGRSINITGRSASFDPGTANTITLKAALDGSISFESSTTESSEDVWDEEFS